jgi:hypothetical protein
MGRRPRVDQTPEEKWQIVQEGIKSGNVSETSRRHGISPTLFPHVRRAPRPDSLPGATQVSRSKGPALCWRKGWGTRPLDDLVGPAALFCDCAVWDRFILDSSISCVE